MGSTIYLVYSRRCASASNATRPGRLPEPGERAADGGWSVSEAVTNSRALRLCSGIRQQGTIELPPGGKQLVPHARSLESDEP